jgi:flagellar biosynthesis protein FlhG
MAKEGILITTPEPTSIENTYRFLKCLFLRRIRNILNSDNGGKIKVQLQKVLYNRNGLRSLTIAAMLEELRTLDRMQGQTLRALMGGDNISIVINQTKRLEDKTLGQGIKRACFDYFGIEISSLGNISYDDCVGDSIRYRRPLCIDYKNSEPARDIEAFVCLMLEKKDKILKIR